MRYITGFFRFWYDFLIGDSWQIAVGVALVMMATRLLITAMPQLAPTCPHRSPDPADPGCMPAPCSPPPLHNRGLAHLIPDVNPAPESECVKTALAARAAPQDPWTAKLRSAKGRD